ncbi:MAG: methyl-accepting chemotaxis protein, partial [Bacillota bacterium]
MDDSMAGGLQQVISGLEAIVARTSIGSARNALRLKALASRTQDSYTGVRQVSEAAEQIQQGIQVVASSAGDVAHVARRVQEESESGHDRGRQAGEAARTLQDHIHEMAVRLETLVERVRDVTRVAGILNEITAQTRLLSLNAAIEAARAGEHGRGFAVVADEVRALADKAATQTKEINALVREITAQLTPAQASVTQSRDLADVAASHTAAAGQSLETIRSLASQSAMHMEQVAAAVEEQTALMESLHGSARQVTEGIDGVQQEAGHISQATAHVSRVSEEAYQYLGQMEGDTKFHRVLKECRQLAVDGRRVLEEVIDRGR